MERFAPHYLRKRGAMIGPLSPTWTGWILFHPLKPLALEGTPMSLRTQDMFFGALLPHTTTPSAPRHLAEYPYGYYQ
jgi:hypothetical protein